MNLRDYRKRQKISQCQLAKLLGVKQPTVSCWENGISAPTLSNIYKLTEILNCTSDELLGISDSGGSESNGVAAAQCTA